MFFVLSRVRSRCDHFGFWGGKWRKKNFKTIEFFMFKKKKFSEKNRQNKNTGFATLATSQN